MTVKITNWLFAAVFCLAVLPVAAQTDGADHHGAAIDPLALGDIAPEAGYAGEEQQPIATVQEAERFSASDPRLAVYLANLATLYQYLGRDDEATDLFQRALGMWSVGLVAEDKV